MERNSEEAKWSGRELVDVNGDSIGTIVGLRDMRHNPGWLLVQTGPPESKKVLLPADSVLALGDRLVAPYHGNYVRGVPGIESEESLSEAEERRLCLRYGLEYASSDAGTGKGCGLCRRRKRAERPQE